MGKTGNGIQRDYDLTPLKSIEPSVLSTAPIYIPNFIYSRTKQDLLPNEVTELINEPIAKNRPREILDQLRAGRLYADDSLDANSKVWFNEKESGELTGKKLYQPKAPLYAAYTDGPKVNESFMITEKNVDTINDDGNLKYAIGDSGRNLYDGKYYIVNPFSRTTQDKVMSNIVGQRPGLDLGYESYTPGGIKAGNVKIPDSQYGNLRAHQLDAALARVLERHGISDDILQKAGIKGGYNGLTINSLPTLYSLGANTENPYYQGAIPKEDAEKIKNAIYSFLAIDSTKQNIQKRRDEVNRAVDFYNQYYDPNVQYHLPYKNLDTGEITYMDSDGNYPDLNSFANGGRINTSNRFANGGRMSRKASEATRGNARLVRKREEDDDDAYFQDTPRGGSDIDTLAVRVMRGELGTGEQLRRNLGTKYQAVQRRVKQLRASQGGMMGDDVDEFADDELSENAFANGGRLSRITRPNDKRYEIYF